MKKKIKTFFKRFYKVIKKPEMILLPGQLAYSFVLAIIPTMTLISYGASVLNLSTAFIYDFLAKAFGGDIANLILTTSSSANAGLKLTILLFICYFIVSNGTASVIATSNTIYGIENHNWFKRRFKAIVMAIILILIIIFLLVIPIFGNHIVNFIKSVNLDAGVTRVIVLIFNYLKSPIMWILLFFLIKLIYVLAPDREVSSQNTNYGALFTTCAWIVVTQIYSFYINNIANFSAIYGSLASVCVLMIWFYFIAYLFVIGMGLNYQRENEKTSIKNN